MLLLAPALVLGLEAEKRNNAFTGASDRSGWWSGSARLRHVSACRCHVADMSLVRNFAPGDRGGGERPIAAYRRPQRCAKSGIGLCVALCDVNGAVAAFPVRLRQHHLQ